MRSVLLPPQGPQPVEWENMWWGKSPLKICGILLRRSAGPATVPRAVRGSGRRPLCEAALQALGEEDPQVSITSLQRDPVSPARVSCSAAVGSALG